MAQFPLLKTGAVAQYPLAVSRQFRTNVTRFVDGKDVRFAEAGKARVRWAVRLAQLDSREAAQVEEFVRSLQGGAGTFAFTDPTTGTTYPEARFVEHSFAIGMTDENNCSVVLTIEARED